MNNEVPNDQSESVMQGNNMINSQPENGMVNPQNGAFGQVNPTSYSQPQNGEPSTNTSSVVYEKPRPVVRTLKFDFIFLTCWYSVVLVLSIFSGSRDTLLGSVIVVGGLVFGISSASKENLSAGIVGIIYAVILIIFGGIEKVLGLFLLIHSIKYLKNV